MTESLKAKLREICERLDTAQMCNISHFIQEIDQAYKEEGYVHSDAKEKADALVLDMQNVLTQSQKRLTELKQSFGYVYTKPDEMSKVMTGQEWYQRFQDNLAGQVFPHHCNNDMPNVANAVERCKEAAKKAAGIN